MVNAADRVVLYIDAIVVTTFIGLAAVTPYEIGAKLIPYFMSLVLAITWTMTPYATACDARGDMDALRRLLLKGTRGSLFIASVICAGLLLAGDEFLLIWMDPQFLDEGTSYAIMAVLAWATLARASTSCGRQILFGMRRMKLLASLAFTEAGLNIGLSIVLVQHYGLIGVAWGTLISIVVAYVITQNVFIVRLTGVSGHHYLWQILRATVPVIGSMYLVSLWTDTWLVVNSWSWFGVEVLLLMVPVIPIGYLLVMNEDEREIIKRRLPFRRK
jgi:O-antigen/teichoic acid export membrane protein